MAMELFAIFTTWWQNLSLLLRQKVDLPSLFDFVRTYLLALLSLELNNVPLIEYLSEIRDYTRVDYRIQYIILCICMPLCATFLTMLLFRSLYMILWYFTLLTGISLIFASFIGFLLPRSKFSAAISNVEIFGSYVSAEVVTLVLGCFFLFVCFCVALVFLTFKSLSIVMRKYKNRKRIATSVPTPADDTLSPVELPDKDTHDASDTEHSSSAHNSVELASALPYKSGAERDKRRGSSIDMAVRLRLEDSSSSLVTRDDSFSSQGSTASDPVALNKKHDRSSKRKSHIPSESSTLTINVKPMTSNVSTSSLDESSVDKAAASKKEQPVDSNPDTPASGNVLPTYDMIPSIKRRSIFTEIVLDIVKGDQQYSASRMERRKKKALKIRPLTVMRNFAIALVLLLLGLFMVQALKISYFGASDSNAWDNVMTSSTWGMVCIVTGSILLAFSLLFVLLGCLNCWKPGRLISYFLMNFVRVNMLKVLFVLIALVYTPIITALFSAFVCENVTCEVGSRHTVRYNTFSLGTLFRSNESAACESCTWHANNYCPAALSDQICPQVTDSRLFIDPTLSCYNDIAFFFWLPSALLGVAFSIGLPLLYCSLTRESVKYFHQFDVDILKKKNLPIEILKPRKARNLERKRQLGDEEQSEGEELKPVETKRPRDQDQMDPLTTNHYRSSLDEEQNTQSTSTHDTKADPVHTDSDAEEPLVIEDVGEEHPDNYVPRYLSELRNMKRKKTFQESIRNITHSVTAMTPAKIKKSFLSSQKMEEWRIRTAVSKNPVRSLYQHYEFRTNQFALFNLVYKLIVVVVSVTLVFYPAVSVGISIGLHGTNAFVILLLRPYIVFGEDVFAGAVGWLSLINAIYVFVAIWVEFGNWSFWVLLALNTIVPLMALTLSFTHFYRGIISSYLYTKRLKRIEKACQDIEDEREGIQQLRTFIKEDLRRKYNVDYVQHDRHDYGFVKLYLKRLRRQHKDVDLSLSNVTLKRVLYFFLFLGVCCFVGLINTTIGVLYGELNPVAVPPALEANILPTCEERINMEFVGYHNWTSFTDNCCCAQATHYMGSLIESKYQQVEMWSCVNGVQKERVRVALDNGVTWSGLQIRGFCNRTFEAGYQLNGCAIDQNKRAMIQLEVPADSTTTGYERQWLW